MATPAGSLNWADVAGPPSPLWPLNPMPATVAMIPEVDILQIRSILLIGNCSLNHSMKNSSGI
jgi:hypothetical protein